MYRLLIFLALLNFVEPCMLKRQGCGHNRPPRTSRLHHKWYFKRHPERFYDQIAEEVISTARKVQQYCNENPHNNVKEIYGSDKYKIVIELEDYEEPEIEVKIKYRALLVYVVNGKQSVKKISDYANVMVLPTIIKTNEAIWNFENGELKITIPYTPIENDGIKYCKATIDDTLITVPMSDEQEEPVIDIRMNLDVESTTEGIKINEKVFLT